MLIPSFKLILDVLRITMMFSDSGHGQKKKKKAPKKAEMMHDEWWFCYSISNANYDK